MADTKDDRSYDHQLPVQHWRSRVGLRLIELRKRAHMSRTYVDKALRWPKETVRKYEDAINFPSLKRVIQLAQLYDCSTDFILLGLGWGGVELPDYDALMKQPGFAAEQAPAHVPRMRSIDSMRRKAPPPLNIGIKHAEKAKASASKTPKAAAKKPTPKKSKKGKMAYDFKLD